MCLIAAVGIIRMTIPLDPTILPGVLTLIEEAHKSVTRYQFRQTLIHGMGSLIASNSCVWTEMEVSFFKRNEAHTLFAELSDPDIDHHNLLPIFNAYAHQHPVIKHAINSKETKAFAISDYLDRDSFHKLELYQHFYQTQNVEDQLSAGLVENDQLKGLSIHRNTWGFNEEEHELLSSIAACTFPFYQQLPLDQQPSVEQAPIVQMSIDGFEQHHEKLGITQRQAQLLSLVARGQSNKQIVDKIGISEGTVRKHLENCFRNLGVHNRVGAVIMAITILDS